jgi:hypothetical protein
MNSKVLIMIGVAVFVGYFFYQKSQPLIFPA